MFARPPDLHKQNINSLVRAAKLQLITVVTMVRNPVATVNNLTESAQTTQVTHNIILEFIPSGVLL